MSLLDYFLQEFGNNESVSGCNWSTHPVLSLRSIQLWGIPYSPEELCQELCRLLHRLLPPPGQGQAQREHPPGQSGPHHSYWLWFHPLLLSKESWLWKLSFQVDFRCWYLSLSNFPIFNLFIFCSEFVDVMGGVDSDMFAYFKILILQGESWIKAGGSEEW